MAPGAVASDRDDAPEALGDRLFRQARLIASCRRKAVSGNFGPTEGRQEGLDELGAAPLPGLWIRDDEQPLLQPHRPSTAVRA